MVQGIKDVCFLIVYDSFVLMCDVFVVCGVEKVLGVLLDLGVFLLQVDDLVCGFSFCVDGLLDM